MGNSDGISWPHAYSDLQDALEKAHPGDSILVAKGTYKPAGSGGDVTAKFLINIDITLLGGYPNGGGDRNPDMYETILSGDLNGDDVEDIFFAIGVTMQ